MLDVGEHWRQELRVAIDRGEGIELTPELMDEIELEAEEMVRLGRKPKLDVCK